MGKESIDIPGFGKSKKLNGKEDMPNISVDIPPFGNTDVQTMNNNGEEPSVDIPPFGQPKKPGSKTTENN